MTVIIDRRNDDDRYKFEKDKIRFLNRIRDSVRKAVHDKVTEGSIRNFEKDGVKIPIPKRRTTIPVIHHTQGPNFKKVFPGNLFEVGDIVPVPPSGGGGGGQGKGNGPDASDGEDSKDDFVWLSEDEFLDIFFEGRSLPDLTKLNEDANPLLTKQRSGHTTKGPAHRMDMNVTNKKRKKDELILNKASERRILENLLEQYNIYRSYRPDLPEINFEDTDRQEKLEILAQVLETLKAQFTLSAEQTYKNPTLTAMFNCVDLLAENLAPEVIAQPDDRERLEILRERLPEQIKVGERAKRFQNNHLTYHFDDDVPKPITKAVMICKMDVSGSMGQEEKNTAKAFFWVLNKFLVANYEDVEVVFISHTTTAEEVDEQEFFYGDRTGGTLVSSCLEKELEVISKRYPVSQWNIYSAQASDGDNMTSDNARVVDFMRKILPMQQASYFIEVKHPYFPDRADSDLHKVYKELAKEFKNLKTASVTTPADSLEAFKKFFPVNGSAPSNAFTPG